MQNQKKRAIRGTKRLVEGTKKVAQATEDFTGKKIPKPAVNSVLHAVKALSFLFR